MTQAQLFVRASPALVLVDSEAGRGSGFIVDSKGLALTNAHLVRGLDEVLVTLPSQGVVTAKIVGRDEFMDLAVLQLTVPSNLPALPFTSDLSTVGPGLEVAAVGYPAELLLGLAAFVTRGTVLSQRSVGGVQYLQTDKALDPGNAGGPLLNLYGDVVGVNTDQIVRVFGRPVAGIGLAIHIASVKARLDRLARGAQYYRPTQPGDIVPPGALVTPPFPKVFTGAAIVDGVPAPDGVPVYARLGRYVSQVVTVRGGRYPFLTVQPPLDEGFTGQEIVFYVDGFPASIRVVYKPDIDNPSQVLDLDVKTPP